MSVDDAISSFECKSSNRNLEDIPQEWLLMWGANKLREAGQLVDITLVVQGKKIKPCHKVVLAAGSPYFRAMFTHDVLEQSSDEVELKDVDCVAVETIVNYLYTATVKIDDDNAQELLSACSLLQVLGLHGKCRRYIESRLCIQNSIEIYTFAKSLCCKELKDVAFSLMTRRFADVTSTDAFLLMSKDDLIDVLNADELMVENEEKVYESALSWIAHNVEERGQSISEIFSYIRMALLDERFLNECIAQEDLLMAHPMLCANVKAALKFKSISKERPRCSDKPDTNQPDGPNLQPPDGANESGNTSPSTDTADSDTETAAKAEEDFLRTPYFNVPLSGTSKTVRIPLNVRRRAGMATQSLLLFTNGRRTVVFEPGTKRYHCGVQKAASSAENVNQSSDTSEDPTAGIDPSMPIMKNAEVFATQNGAVYLIGGLQLQKTENGTSIKAKVFMFDVERLTWNQRASLDEPRCMMGLGELHGQFCVTGGKGLSQNTTLSTMHIYDFDSDKWQRGPDLPIGLYGHGCASTRDCLFLIGGKTEEKDIMSAVYSLSSPDGQWSATYSLQVPRFLLGATAFSSTGSKENHDFIYVVGGIGPDGPLSTVEYLDLCDGKCWKFGKEFPGDRCAQTVTVVNQSLCAVGGHVTERAQNHHYESKQKYDVYTLTSVDPEGPKQWLQTTSHVRGIAGHMCASTCLLVDPSRLGAHR